MEHVHQLVLLDVDGQLLDTRIARVLLRLLPRLRRQFPQLTDEVTVTEVMERSGSRLASRERRTGPIEKLHGYAWVTLRSVAMSELRRSSARLLQRTVESTEGQARLASATAGFGSPEALERQVLLRELLETLSHEERLVCVWKKAGFSSQEIAGHQGRSVASVDTLFSRAKEKLRKVLGIQGTKANANRSLINCSRKHNQPSD